MRHLFLLLITTFSLLTTAHASDFLNSANDLPDDAVVEPMWTADFERPLCPRGYVVAKKYCWSSENLCFEHCGYFCSKVKKPNDPSERH